MTAQVFLQTLQARGFALSSAKGALSIQPASRLTDEDRATIREHKPALMALVAEREAAQSAPHINAQGDLVIPFNSNPKYHYWKTGGQSILATLAELDAPKSLFAQHGYKHETDGEVCRCGESAKSTSEVFYCSSCGLWWERQA